MKKSDWLFLIFLFACLQFNCSSEKQAPQQSLYANFEIRYLKPERHLRAQASFAKGDSINRKPISFPTVHFEERAMDLKKLSNKVPRYQAEQHTDYQSSFSFRMIDENNKEINYDLQMSPIDSFQIDGPIQKSKELKLNWYGAPLKENESLILLFTDQDNKASSQNINGPTEKAELSIPAPKLSKLSPGKGQLYLVKKQINFHNDQNSKFRSLIEFYTNSIDIEVQN